MHCIQFTQDVVWSHKMLGILYEMSNYQLLNDTTQCSRCVRVYCNSWQHIAALSTNSNVSSVFLCTYVSKWYDASCVDCSLLQQVASCLQTQRRTHSGGTPITCMYVSNTNNTEQVYSNKNHSQKRQKIFHFSKMPRLTQSSIEPLFSGYWGILPQT